MREVTAKDSNVGLVLKTRWQIFRAYTTSALVDHGIFRYFYQNFHEIAPGVFRSSQPTPGQLAKAKLLGVRTIINLRGANESASHYLLERNACTALGLTLIDFTVHSRDLPTPEVLRCAIKLFDDIAYPVLFHCKSGADRTGFMGALFLLTHNHRPISDALKQLSWGFGHFRQSKTGILDHFFETYRDYQENTGKSFTVWINEDYERETLKQSFLEDRWVSLCIDRVLRRE